MVPLVLSLLYKNIVLGPNGGWPISGFQRLARTKILFPAWQPTIHPCVIKLRYHQSLSPKKEHLLSETHCTTLVFLHAYYRSRTRRLQELSVW